MPVLNLKDQVKSTEKIQESKEIIEKSGGREKEGAIPERAPEREAEVIDLEKILDIKEGKGGLETAGAGPAPSAIQKRKAQEKQIEKILSAGLEETYLNMPPAKQQEFKEVGEETVVEINNALDKAKVKIKKIIGLIKRWLSIIPGVNMFFLEQESKIKADEIMKIKNKL